VVVLTIATFIQRRLRAARMRRRAAFVAAYMFPAELDDRVAVRLPALTREERAQVLEGLRQYFLVAIASLRGRIARRLGMPSRAVDEAWQEFIAMHREYAEFCHRAFGRVLRHRAVSTTETGASDALANTLHQLKRDAPHGAAWAMLAGVPLLFALDGRLALAGGQAYDAPSLDALEAKRQALIASAPSSGSFTSTSDSDPEGDGDWEEDSSSGGGDGGGDYGGGGDSGGGGDGGGGGGDG